MSKKLQTIIVSISILGLVALFSGACFQEVITPCWISPISLKYADVNATSLLPWTTLFDAKRVDRMVDFKHTWNQATDTLRYKLTKGLNAIHISVGEELKATLFSPMGPIGLMFPALGGTALGTFLLSKPKDKKKIAELERKVKNGGNL